MTLLNYKENELYNTNNISNEMLYAKIDNARQLSLEWLTQNFFNHSFM